MKHRRKRKVYLVAQSAWDTDRLSMPLALGYLKAFALKDPELANNYEFEIFNFSRSVSPTQMAIQLFRDPPDVIGFSVLGWSQRAFGALAETYKQVNPNGLCVFGGSHASHQAHRLFRLFRELDIVVNGEGEQTFHDLLLARLNGARLEDFVNIAGVSVRIEPTRTITTPDRPRMTDLDLIPSPFLTGALALNGSDGRFLYDVALMETNRGCPYSCSFCYWGGAIGQKIHSFSRERLREELEFLASRNVENICLCDANFGMLKADAEFVEDMIGARERYGYPKTFVSSWAKNKSKTFFQIVTRLRDAGLHADFTLSLQTLNPRALDLMRRKNMRINEFEELCAWLEQEGLSSHIELIWGAPGETVESFIEGYNRLAEHTSRIATYPLCVMPNTEYAVNRARYGLITVRDSATDYEFVLAHESVSLEGNQGIYRFLFWARLLGEYRVLREIWKPLRKWVGLRQSDVLQSIDEFFAHRTDSLSRELQSHLTAVAEMFDVTRVQSAVLLTYLREDELRVALLEWWDASIAPNLRPDIAVTLRELLRYDLLARPIHDDVAERIGLRTEEVNGVAYYVRTCDFDHDILELIEGPDADSVEPHPAYGHAVELTLLHRVGFAAVADSHELVSVYVGRPHPGVTNVVDGARRVRARKPSPRVLEVIG